jgi:UDP-2-acetamido-3-amino-2,3-dideoxy-glucuronate N-acetyltransferase
MTYFVHQLGLCETTSVGGGTRIWAFAHVLPGAVIGKDCNVCDHVFIENDTVLGDRVTVKSGVQIWDGIHIGSDVFIGPNATFTNDRFPRSKAYQESVLRTRIADGVSLGANCTVLPGLQIGRGAMVGAGSVVTKDVPPNAIVVGNPARIVGYVDSTFGAAPSSDPGVRSELPQVIALPVRGVSLHRLTRVDDLRGSLVAGDASSQVPFVPQRFFVVFGVPSRDVRGEHAHLSCEQFLVCTAGSVTVVVDDGRSRHEVVLDSPDVALYLPPLVWAVQYKYSGDASLLVLASKPYDASDYIRDYDEFLRLVNFNLPNSGMATD